MSLPSSHSSSSGMEQSAPSQPFSQRQLQPPSGDDLHCPCLEHSLGQPSKVQCLPFQPATHKQVPFLHCPCSLHLFYSNIFIKIFMSNIRLSIRSYRGSQRRSLQNSPDHPASQTHELASHRPCPPQLIPQAGLEQSSPVQPSVQTHLCNSRLKVP